MKECAGTLPARPFTLQLIAMAVLLAVFFLSACPREATLPQEARKIVWSARIELPALQAIASELAKPLSGKYEVRLKRPAGQQRAVETCLDYLSVLEVGFELATDREYQILRAEGLRCRALQALSQARPARRSFLEEFRLGPQAADILPPSLSVAVAPDEEERMAAEEAKGSSWKAYEPRLRIIVKGDEEIAVEGDGWNGSVVLYARADFDGDGIEDLMLRRDGELPGGTYRTSALFLLTRVAAKGRLKVLRHLD
jgi:hypothetical protein